jgi:hypothetical protein
VSSKICTGCRIDKSHAEFWKNRNSGDGFQHYCKSCHREKTVDHRTNAQKNKSWRARWLASKYGLAERDYSLMLLQQGGVCAICEKAETSTNKHGTVKMLAVDHDEETGIIRGLLCEQCNTGIGKLRHDPLLMLKAAEYVNLRLKILTA